MPGYYLTFEAPLDGTTVNLPDDAAALYPTGAGQKLAADLEVGDEFVSYGVSHTIASITEN
ncbi:hypothetical protein LCGC14_3016470 [marine sediment metagenome]|uniref:Uncharacterized protein n=1 Tax=marine sediment metagenome TaxID=412755 RepID=A0A0F8Z476_9ZZZZ